MSSASPFARPFPDRLAGEPLRAVAAVAREVWKVGKYTPALPASTPPHTFTSLVSEVCGRVGPKTAAFLRDALGSPGGSTARRSFLTAVAVAVWRSNARAAADGINASFVTGDPPGSGAEGSAGPCGNSVTVGD